MKKSERKFLFDNQHYLTDGGIETTLIFQKGIELNHFAAFELLNTEEGRNILKSCYTPYLDIAAKYGLPAVIETPTWRANPDWGYRLGYTIDELMAFNKMAVEFTRKLFRGYEGKIADYLVSGNLGPRGDGYITENPMSVAEAKAYHSHQVRTFALADADLVCALTINYREEGIGIIEAAKSFNIPVAISYTLETDGNLQNGEKLSDVILETDEITGSYAEHYMINCAHPDHFTHIFAEPGEWKSRIRGVRANASSKSHEELEEFEGLDAGDKSKLAKGYSQLKQFLPELRVLGGCCGTDHNHIDAVCARVFSDNKSLVEKEIL